MNTISFFLLLWYYLFICNHIANGYCPDDQDLQRHLCTCSLEYNYIQCSSLPNQCLTCYRYKGIVFDEKVNIIPAEAFRFYDFFANDKKFLFTIRFIQINTFVSNSFSKMNISRDRTLDIKIITYLSSILPTRIFEDSEIQSKSKLNIEIFNITSSIFTIKQKAFNGIKFHSESHFRLSIFNAKDTIQFESNSGSLLLPSYSSMELYFSNFIQVIFNQQSFENIEQKHSSEFIINFNHFQYATLLQNSFVNIRQLHESRFHLSLLNFHSLTIEQTLFERIIQSKSYIIISIYNITNDLCLPNKAFHEITQNLNSTLQFEINYGQNLLFTSNSITSINQNLQSKFSIIITNCFDIYFSRYAISNIDQEDHSSMDISVNYGQNLIFDDYAIDNMNMNHSSSLRIGFQNSRGTLQMATNSFSNINEGQDGELIFQILNLSNFYFRFNQTTWLKRLTIIGQSLSSSDFCRISNIPSHISVKLLHTYQCSCTVYYLYRNLHRKRYRTDLENVAPLCYTEMSPNEIEYMENECLFSKKIYNCQQMEGEIQINVPQAICQNHVKLNKYGFKKSSSFFSVILIILIGGLLIFSATCISILSLSNRGSSLSNSISTFFYRYRRQRLPIFSADLYEELTTNDLEDSNTNGRNIIVTYNVLTKQTEPRLDNDKIDFIIADKNNHQVQIADMQIKFNTNPISDIDDHDALETTIRSS